MVANKSAVVLLFSIAILLVQGFLVQAGCNQSRGGDGGVVEDNAERRVRTEDVREMNRICANRFSDTQNCVGETHRHNGFSFQCHMNMGDGTCIVDAESIRNA